jgi:CDP-glucose 4,6-dehydratase
MAIESTRELLRAAYSGKRVLVTGHTGFKGSWLVAWLADLGADVTGYALAPATTPAMFDLLDLRARCATSVEADIRDRATLTRTVREVRPDFVFHLAAQALVRQSYAQPFETLDVNVMGTAALLESIREGGSPCSVVVVTSDKCYENREWQRGYREDDAMGGHDVYSMSKGAAELVVASWRRSFAPAFREHGVRIATARAGNVIGGGDWAADRIVPDLARAFARGDALSVRNPDSVRPWQHVLEPLSGYLVLGARLASSDDPSTYAEAFNFGPPVDETRSVRELADAAVAAWGSGRWIDAHDGAAPHEAKILRLAIDKAREQLGWVPRWGFGETVSRTVAWYRAHASGASSAELAALTTRDIADYENAVR